jgi:hypothetical protein
MVIMIFEKQEFIDNYDNNDTNIKIEMDLKLIWIPPPWPSWQGESGVQSFDSRNIIFFKKKNSRQENSHPSRARVLVARAASCWTAWVQFPPFPQRSLPVLLMSSIN